MGPDGVMPTPLWRRASAFSTRAHDGQFRRDGATPYIVHPHAVAMTVRHVFGCDDEVTLAIALLHDTIEDTTVDYDDLLEAFGPEVAEGGRGADEGRLAARAGARGGVRRAAGSG